VDVGKDVFVDVAAKPEMLDVGIADVAVDPGPVVGRAPATRIEVGADAPLLVGEAQQQRCPGQHDDDREHQRHARRARISPAAEFELARQRTLLRFAPEQHDERVIAQAAPFAI